MVFLKHIPDAFISFSCLFLWSLVGGIVVFYDQNLRKNDIIRKQKKIFNFKKHTLGPNNSITCRLGPFHVVVWWSLEGWPIENLQKTLLVELEKNNNMGYLRFEPVLVLSESLVCGNTQAIAVVVTVRIIIVA